MGCISSAIADDEDYQLEEAPPPHYADAPPPYKVVFPLSAGNLNQGSRFAPDTMLQWVQVSGSGKNLPPNLFVAGEDFDGAPEFIARTRLVDGSLRPGRITRNFDGGLRVACELLICVRCLEITYHISLALSMQSIPLKSPPVRVKYSSVPHPATKFTLCHGLKAIRRRKELRLLACRRTETPFLQALLSTRSTASAACLLAMYVPAMAL